jgi:hypothetical protein
MLAVKLNSLLHDERAHTHTLSLSHTHVHSYLNRYAHVNEVLVSSDDDMDPALWRDDVVYWYSIQ